MAIIDHRVCPAGSLTNDQVRRIFNIEQVIFPFSGIDTLQYGLTDANGLAIRVGSRPNQRTPLVDPPRFTDAGIYPAA